MPDTDDAGRSRALPTSCECATHVVWRPQNRSVNPKAVPLTAPRARALARLRTSAQSRRVMEATARAGAGAAGSLLRRRIDTELAAADDTDSTTASRKAAGGHTTIICARLPPQMPFRTRNQPGCNSWRGRRRPGIPVDCHGALDAVHGDENGLGAKDAPVLQPVVHRNADQEDQVGTGGHDAKMLRRLDQQPAVAFTQFPSMSACAWPHCRRLVEATDLVGGRSPTARSMR